jgi:hypothetical protein
MKQIRRCFFSQKERSIRRRKAVRHQAVIQVASELNDRSHLSFSTLIHPEAYSDDQPTIPDHDYPISG